ncbi:methyltransferase [Pseudoxanthomonas sp. UTMC 1351]|uniref:methyltransferase n=1 Tax=Pseudoxanthomonas sp. UTMC 1351 TaxID=2695853 RepID=UPI0034CFF8CF
MSAYLTRLLDIRIGGHDFQIRALKDLQQFSDPDGAADQAGISSALWSLFGQAWPAGRIMADEMSHHDIAGKRVLEIGCGLGLASLVLQRRGADITASDHHPLAESFLMDNAELNGLPAIPYCDLRWERPDEALGLFDLIIGSDVLYERGHARLLAALVRRHGQPSMEVLITDPGRGNSGAFSRAMSDLGFVSTEQRLRFKEEDTLPFRGRLLKYLR